MQTHDQILLRISAGVQTYLKSRIPGRYVKRWNEEGRRKTGMGVDEEGGVSPFTPLLGWAHPRDGCAVTLAMQCESVLTCPYTRDLPAALEHSYTHPIQHGTRNKARKWIVVVLPEQTRVLARPVKWSEFTDEARLTTAGQWLPLLSPGDQW